MKKQISFLLIAAQMTLGVTAFAATPVGIQGQVVTPEMTMLKSVFALEGQTLSTEARSARVSGILDQYTKVAPKDGREDRMESALVQLGVYSPAQAKSFMAQSQAADTAVRATQATTSGETRQVLANQVAELAQLHPMGAQFSVCDVGYIAGLAGITTAIAGLVLRYDNPSCYDQYQGSSYGCYYDAYGNYLCGTSDYYTTQCTQADYYPHRSLGNGMLIGGGIAAAIGAVLVLTQPNCS